jgi:hypothetical protein
MTGFRTKCQFYQYAKLFTHSNLTLAFAQAALSHAAIERFVAKEPNQIEKENNLCISPMTRYYLRIRHRS